MNKMILYKIIIKSNGDICHISLRNFTQENYKPNCINIQDIFARFENALSSRKFLTAIQSYHGTGINNDKCHAKSDIK